MVDFLKIIVLSVALGAYALFATVFIILGLHSKEIQRIIRDFFEKDK